MDYAETEYNALIERRAARLKYLITRLHDLELRQKNLPKEIRQTTKNIIYLKKEINQMQKLFEPRMEVIK